MNPGILFTAKKFKKIKIKIKQKGDGMANGK